MPRHLLFLCHRLPWPPDKGEKIRAWHMLDHLARDWDVDLGCLLDDPADAAHLPVLRDRCATIMAQPIGRFARAARALAGLRPGQPLTARWFHAPALAAWVDAGLRARHWDAAFVYSSGMAPYLMRPGATPPPVRILDMVDVDSAKWAAYAAAGRGPMRLVWAREARTLLGLERRAATAFDQTIVVSEAERNAFAALAPDVAERTDWVDNGVDLLRFDCTATYPDPYGGVGPAIVFTGSMDYRPNIDAVAWFVAEVLPRLRAGVPDAAFHIVGARPAAAVLALAAQPGVRVAGAVADIRPWLAHAAVAVAPLRIARGIQNKVLEAMAMARPVVASSPAFEGVHAVAGRDLLVADDPVAMAAAITAVLRGAHPGLGPAGRAAVAAGHDWTVALRRLDRLMDRSSSSATRDLLAARSVNSQAAPSA